ncbi:uncharacterized protein LOC6599867 [Drosophila persimilis]|uniref:uncharacterized protein LOC6599867 n=1 Tax=Drosophila persimilis TaxID=7234 RepID=UPI000F08934C|nr:uncharacterized protein LOC6599867 [Drosophila persimilis]
MYRAVMEEVARFFERYQQQLHLQQTHRHGEQIARSKSLHHVHGVGVGVGVGGGSSLQGDQRGDALLLHDEDHGASASYLRARSSTNLMLNKSMHAMNEEHNYEPIAPAGSYNAFKDFTWRRSPKKSGGCKARLSGPEAAEEKLNQEAFRLARTIRNLLHTSEQQPDLTQPRHSLASVYSLPGSGNGNANGNGHGNGHGNHMPHLHRLCKAKTSSVMTLLQTPPRHNSTSIMNASLSMEVPSPCPSASTGGGSGGGGGGSSSTEDESGFSSISSFHDVGLPLSSTLIAGGGGINHQSRPSVTATDSRNSTLKSGALNVLGVPVPHPNPQQSNPQPSKTTYRNAGRYQRFSTLSNEDAAAVLWV